MFWFMRDNYTVGIAKIAIVFVHTKPQKLGNFFLS